MKTKEEILENIVKNAFDISVNLSDTFHYACADSETISGDDYIELIPLIKKYGYYAEVAYFALKRGYDPQVKKILTPEFYQAKEDIISMIEAGDRFRPFYGLSEDRDIENREDIPKMAKETYKTLKTAKYKNISECFKDMNINVGDTLNSLSRVGFQVKINAIGKENALVEIIVNPRHPGFTGWEYALDFYSFSREFYKFQEEN